MLQSLTVGEKQGSRSTFVFSNFKENPGLSDKTFAFSIPRGADVTNAGPSTLNVIGVAWLPGPRALAVSAALRDHELAGLRAGEQRRDSAQHYDLAVVEYTKALRANPDDDNARLALERAKLRASQDHFRARTARRVGTLRRSARRISARLGAQPELRPTSTRRCAIRGSSCAPRSRSRENGKTELESLIERTRGLPPPGPRPAGRCQAARLARLQSAPAAATSSRRSASSPTSTSSSIRRSAKRRSPSTCATTTLDDALTSVTASTRNFYRVTRASARSPSFPTRRPSAASTKKRSSARST